MPALTLVGENALRFLCSEPEWEFMKKLEDVEAVEREKALMECDVSDPEADVTWWRGDKVHHSCLLLLDHLFSRQIFIIFFMLEFLPFQLR